jgi:hypothetical protein
VGEGGGRYCELPTLSLQGTDVRVGNTYGWRDGGVLSFSLSFWVGRKSKHKITTAFSLLRSWPAEAEPVTRDNKTRHVDRFSLSTEFAVQSWKGWQSAVGLGSRVATRNEALLTQADTGVLSQKQENRQNQKSIYIYIYAAVSMFWLTRDNFHSPYNLVVSAPTRLFCFRQGREKRVGSCWKRRQT